MQCALMPNNKVEVSGTTNPSRSYLQDPEWTMRNFRSFGTLSRARGRHGESLQHMYHTLYGTLFGAYVVPPSNVSNSCQEGDCIKMYLVRSKWL
jgi:hypothetical protein